MSLSTPIRWGVLGAGWFASRRHIPDIVGDPRCQLSGLCRRDPQAMDTLAQRFQPEKTYSDWREMVSAAGLDAVVIATPHDQHFAQALDCLQRGIHVLLEKPMTVRSEEADELLRAARDRNLELATAVNPPYWPHCRAIREIIASGEIGELEAVSIFWTGNAEYVFGEATQPENLPGVVPPTLFRSQPDACGGGYFIDGGSHLISQLLYTTGLRVVNVACSMDNPISDRRATLTLELENGAMAQVTCVGNSRLGDRRVRNIYAGSHGSITVDGFDFRVTVTSKTGTERVFSEAELPALPGPISNFTSRLLGQEELATRAEHGRDVVEVVEAAYKSASGGMTVTL